MSKKESQNKKIIAYLEDGNVITPIEALTLFGCMRLAARISDLKRRGYIISKTMKTNGDSRYAEYKLEEPPRLASETAQEVGDFEELSTSENNT